MERSDSELGRLVELDGDGRWEVVGDEWEGGAVLLRHSR